MAVERRDLAAQAKESQAAREVASQLATEEREHSLKLAREDRILVSILSSPATSSDVERKARLLKICQIEGFDEAIRRRRRVGWIFCAPASDAQRY